MLSSSSSTAPDAPHSPASALSAGGAARIGVFDSGVGGLSVLRALRAHLPAAHLLYVADSGHAPYGERDESFIEQRSAIISDFLVAQGAQALVVACNTATAAAVHTLRARWSQLPIIGVEPGVKPAVARSVNKRVGVLATPRTLASAKFQALISSHAQGAQVILQPCPGLAREIERGELDSPALRALVQEYSEPLLVAGVDTVVLGCTHYPFVAPLFEASLGHQVGIVDTAEAVARHTARMLALAVPPTLDAVALPAGQVQLWTTGRPEHLQNVAWHWLALQAPVEPLP